MELNTKEDYARMLVGNYIKSIIEDNNIKTQDDVSDFCMEDTEHNDILETIMSIYIDEINDEDGLAMHKVLL